VAADLIPLSEVETRPLVKRCINEDTCKKWGYGFARFKDKPVHVASYRNEAGQVVAQKIRFPDKDFLVLGELKKALPLYGQWLWRDGGKKVVIVEGEIDALSMSQAQQNKWAVVSIPTGASGAKRAIAKAMGWLSQFEEVIFMFDMDEPGKDAATECAQLFPHGKAKIAELPLKDANEMLVAGRVKELLDAMWNARIYTPEAVACVDDVFAEAIAMPTEGIPWPWESLTKLTHGIHRKKAYYLGAGVGIGKTNWAKELQSWLVNEQQLPVGVFMLEEAPGRTLKGIAGKFCGKPFHLPDGDFTQEELEAGIKDLRGKVSLYRHDKMGAEWDDIKDALVYMVAGLGIKDIFLDNLTVMVAHLSATEANEEINRISKDIAELIQKYDFSLYGFSHLNPPKTGEPHERGGKVQEYQFTGSRGLMRFGHYMFGIERNKDPELSAGERNTSTFVLLKDREFGNVGRFNIKYDPKTDQYLEPDEADVYGFDEEAEDGDKKSDF